MAIVLESTAPKALNLELYPQLFLIRAAFDYEA